LAPVAAPRGYVPKNFAHKPLHTRVRPVNRDLSPQERRLSRPARARAELSASARHAKYFAALVQNSSPKRIYLHEAKKR